MFNEISYIIKTSLITFALVTFFKTSAQEVRVIDNKGTINNIRNNNVTTAATTPVDPLENDTWFDTTVPTNVVTKVYDGTTWIQISTTQTVYNGFFIINAPGGLVTTTFNVPVTGLPFKPSQITFTAHANVESTTLDSDSNGIGATSNNDRGIVNSFGTMNGFARDEASISQQVIYVGGHGNSINDISRYASTLNCIGIRFGNQDGVSLGKVTASLATFDASGFTLSTTYTIGDVEVDNANALIDVQPEDVLSESLVVLYTAYK